MRRPGVFSFLHFRPDKFAWDDVLGLTDNLFQGLLRAAGSAFEMTHRRCDPG